MCSSFSAGRCQIADRRLQPRQGLFEEFQIGSGQVIPGFEEAVMGLDLGQSRTTRIEPDQAYGPRNEQMVITFNRDRFPEGRRRSP